MGIAPERKELGGGGMEGEKERKRERGREREGGGRRGCGQNRIKERQKARLRD